MKRQLVSAMIVGAFAVLALGSTDGDSPPADPRAASDSAGARHYNSHFAHGTQNVRAGPGERFPIVRKLRRGDTLSLGTPDANGWARILGADSGYVSVRVGLVRTEPPAEVPDYAGAGPCAEAMRAVHTRMNRGPDRVKRFEEAGVEEVTWWYLEYPRDTYPRYQFSFLQGPYDPDCRTSRIENG